MGISSGISKNEDTDTLKKKVHDKKEHNYHEKLKQEAKSLGISIDNPIETINSQVHKKRQEDYRRKKERQKSNSFSNKSSNSSSIYKRETVYDKDGYLVSDDNGRIVGDGRGGTFWAAWGKDAN